MAANPSLPRRSTARLRLGVALFALGLLAACQDLREFSGEWAGGISPDPVLAHGFVPTATVSLDLQVANRDEITTLVTIEGAPAAPFVPIKRAAGDVLGDVQLQGEPLRTVFGFIEPQGQRPYLAVLSLFPENRVELRLIRGTDEAYGVFALRRVRR